MGVQEEIPAGDNYLIPTTDLLQLVQSTPVGSASRNGTRGLATWAWTHCTFQYDFQINLPLPAQFQSLDVVPNLRCACSCCCCSGCLLLGLGGSPGAAGAEGFSGASSWTALT